MTDDFETQAGVDWKAPRLQAKVFHFAGRLATLTDFPYQDLPVIVREHGGTVSDELTPDVNFLVVEVIKETSGIEKKAAKLNEKGASIQTIASETFLEMILPTAAALRAMLTAGDEGHKHLAMLFETVWRARYKSREKVTYPKYDCRGLDLRDCDLTNVRNVLEHLILDEADLRGVKLTEQESFPSVTAARLDGARLYGWLGAITNCSCVAVDFSFATLRGHSAQSCDFSKANLIHFWFEESQLVDCNFQDSDWTEARAAGVKAEGLNFRSACLRKAECEKATFKSSDFTSANLEQADLRQVNFQGTNLTNANLAGANLMEADLSQAFVDGADFTGAELAEVNWTGVDLSKAKGVAVLPTKQVTAGPKTLELSLLAQKASSVEIRIQVKTSIALWNVWFTASGRGCTGGWSKSKFRPSWQQFTTIQDAILHVTNLLGDGALQADTLRVKGSKTGISPKALKTLVLAALSETFGVQVASADDINLLKQQKELELEQRRKTLLALLDGGGEGVKQWNARYQEREAIKIFHDVDLQGKQLDGVLLNSSINEFDRANFDQASLVNAGIGNSGVRFCNATFRFANLTECKAWSANFDEADFSDANLRKAEFRMASLRNAKFLRADLTGVDFAEAHLQGADFTNAIIDEGAFKTSGDLRWQDPDSEDGWSPAACFQDAEFDEATKFPIPGRFPCDMKWAGRGIDPQHTKALQLAAKTGTLRSDDLLTFLRALHWESPRISSALEMLTADRFQLFAEVTDEHLIGVVKSQSDPDLVYSCRLASSGAFSCCTQNLKPCGGLRGALCKHLLVLLIGMAKSGQLRADRITQWILASQHQAPKIDKVVMSETLLRYKGAEAGEVDWRPMETIPEDYYAL